MSNDQIIFVALNKLEIDPLNVRKTYSQKSTEEFAGSIAAHGIVQNLLVRRAKGNGRYYVSAGGRRYRAALYLAEQEKINTDHPMPVKVISKEEAQELSLAENIMRESMNPADQFEAFRDLADNGQPVADIASKFGTTESIVKKRLALGRVAPELRELFREDKMTLDQLAAFTITDNHDEQVRVWNELPSYHRHAHTIKEALKGEGIKGTDKRIRFIGGLETYEQAGGHVKRDLFDDHSGGFAMDSALLAKLVDEKLAAEAETVKAEGWKWVQCVFELDYDELSGYSRVYPQDVDLTDEQAEELEALEARYQTLEREDQSAENDAELNELGEKITAIESLLEQELYAPEDLENSGALVSLTHGGALRVERGLVKPEDTPDEDQSKPSNENTEQGACDEAPALKHSAPLTEDLTAQKTAALRLELANNADIALASVVHAFLLRLAYPGHYGISQHSALEVSLTHTDLASSMKQPENCLALAELETLSENFTNHIPGNPADLWDWCLDQSRDELLTLLAWASSHALNAVEGKMDRPKEAAHADQVGSAVNIDMHRYFKPEAENYFRHLNRTSIQAAIAEACGDDFADGIASMKKAEGAAFAEKSLKDKNWLPEPVRCGDPTAPEHEDGDLTVTPFPEAAE